MVTELGLDECCGELGGSIYTVEAGEIDLDGDVQRFSSDANRSFPLASYVQYMNLQPVWFGDRIRSAHFFCPRLPHVNECCLM